MVTLHTCKRGRQYLLYPICRSSYFLDSRYDMFISEWASNRVPLAVDMSMKIEQFGPEVQDRVDQKAD